MKSNIFVILLAFALSNINGSVINQERAIDNEREYSEEESRNWIKEEQDDFLRAAMSDERPILEEENRKGKGSLPTSSGGGGVFWPLFCRVFPNAHECTGCNNPPC